MKKADEYDKRVRDRRKRHKPMAELPPVETYTMPKWTPPREMARQR